MKLSSRGHYGLRAMVYLAKPKNNQPIPLRQIASDESIPEAFLEQIFVDLRKAGLVRSVRGPKGGYRLADSPDKIVVGNIVRVLEGSVNIVDCMEDSDGNCCDKNEDCSTKIVWEKLRDTMATVLDGIHLSDLILGGRRMIDTL
ncbi:Rrf2 family transcriptional regulator [Tepidibacillus marianensis]|uniref:RrF2 family transcriptional regulator n=1 Tax=Tepidibacillus marianensis TaxID=3131995 RepID=UPI0030CE88A6